MKTEKPKKLIRWCILGAVGCGFMAAGDWLLGCIPLRETDTGLFNRAYYLSGSYGLWKPVLTVGLGAVGGYAGVSAALAAARGSADVLLLEREFILGGLGTSELNR